MNEFLSGELNALGLLGLTLWLLFREVIGPLIKGKKMPDRRKGEEGTNLMQEVKDILLSVKSDTNRITSQTKDLHEWHSPNEDGRQSWKDQTVVVELLQRILEELKRWNDRQAPDHAD